MGSKEKLKIEALVIALKRIANGHEHPRCKEIHASGDCQCAMLWASDALADAGVK